MKVKEQYVDAVCKEIELQQGYLGGEEIRTIYFGGGTPSQLSVADFEKVFDCLKMIGLIRNDNNFIDMEITLEANPDDISFEYLNSIKLLPFNRISLGVQSFNDSELKFLNRRHSAHSAIQAVNQCKDAGFDNISIDLIYGLPGQSLKIWQQNLLQAIDLNIKHISAYHLIYEEGTVLFQRLKSKKVNPVGEEISLEMFGEMIDRFSEAGFDHYEISNFARKNYYSKHNSSYWNGTHYLGVGASAHSFNGSSRQWNVSSLEKYIADLSNGIIPAEIEAINERIAYNDYIITRMRTSKGISLEEVEKLFGLKVKNECLKQSQPFILEGKVEQTPTHLKLTRKGIFVSDGIISDLLLI